MLGQKNGLHNKKEAGSLTRRSEYNTWENMKSRCYNKNNKCYHYYGGRGIKVCDRWLNSFENFYIDMGKKPTPKHSIDRFPNNNGNYEPSNCRWATQKQQVGNRRNNVFFQFNNETKLISEWASILNIDHAKLSYHLRKGRSIDYIKNNI